jgi:hypothetical protein
MLFLVINSEVFLYYFRFIFNNKKKALKISPELLYKKRDLLFIILDNKKGALA